jgi:hypothetical protein
VHEDDIVVGTHGRSIWILDNISPLREVAKISRNAVWLFQPVTATRTRFNMFSDTPLPPEEPAGQNPPDGAILDYFLPSRMATVKLDIYDQQKNLVCTYSSTDKPRMIDPKTVPYPLHWVRPSQQLSVAPGHHRFVWDLRYPAPRGAESSLSIAAVTGNTAIEPRGPLVLPGTYTVRLNVDGVVQEKELIVRMDPRVDATTEDIRLQQEYSMRCYQAYERLQVARDAIDQRLQDPAGTWKAGEKERLQQFRGNGEPGYGDILYGSIRETTPEKETIVGLQEKWLYMLSVLQSADARPTEQVMRSVTQLESIQKQLMDRQ